MRSTFLVLCLCWLAREAPASVVETRFETPVLAGMSDEIPHVFVDFNHDGQTDLLLYNGGAGFTAYFYGSSSRIAIVSATPPDMGGGIACLNFGSVIGNSLTPVPVDPRVRWYAGDQILDPSILPYGTNSVVGMYDLLPYGPNGNLYNREGVIGYEFMIGGDVHYGYVHFDFRMEAGGSYGRGGILGWAYEDVPGEAIIARSLHSIPEPTATSLLVLTVLLSCRQLKARVKTGVN